MPDFFGLQISSGELKPEELEKNEHRTMNKQCIPKSITLKYIKITRTVLELISG